MPQPTTDSRAGYIAGLRALADALEQHPDLLLPYAGNSINVIPHGGDNQREQLAAWARVLPGAKEKSASHDGTAFYLDGRLHGLNVTVICDREEVCQRVVIGEREVTEEVPDPEAVAALPLTTVTRTEEIVEWRCGSVLAARDEQPAGAR